MVEGYDCDSRRICRVSERQTWKPTDMTIHRFLLLLLNAGRCSEPKSARRRSEARIVERRVRLYDYDASGQLLQGQAPPRAARHATYERVPVDIFAGDTLTPEFGRLTRFGRRRCSSSTTAPSSRSPTRSSGTWPRHRVPARRRARARRGRAVALLRAGARHVGDRKRALPHDDRPSRGRPGTARARPTALEALEARLAGRRFLVGDGARSPISPTTRIRTRPPTRGTTSARTRLLDGGSRSSRPSPASSTTSCRIRQRAARPQQVCLRRLTRRPPPGMLGRGASRSGCWAGSRPRWTGWRCRTAPGG